MTGTYHLIVHDRVVAEHLMIPADKGGQANKCKQVPPCTTLVCLLHSRWMVGFPVGFATLEWEVLKFPGVLTQTASLSVIVTSWVLRFIYSLGPIGPRCVWKVEC